MKCFGPTLLEIGYYFFLFFIFFAPSYQLRLAVTSAVILRMMDVILFHLTHQNLATVTKHTTSTLLWFLECDILIEKISLSMFSFFLFTVLSALHRLQKSPNTFIPVHMHLGPRTRSSQVSLWNLPEELILYILKGLPIRDLLSMRAVSTQSNSSPCEREHLKILDNWNHCFMKNNFLYRWIPVFEISLIAAQLYGIQLAFKMSGLRPIISSISRSMYISLTNILLE